MANTINPVATAGRVREAPAHNPALCAGGMDLGPLHFEIAPEQFSVDGGGYVWPPQAVALAI